MVFSDHPSYAVGGHHLSISAAEIARGTTVSLDRAELEQDRVDLLTPVTPSARTVRVRVFHNTSHAVMADGYVVTDTFVEVYTYDEPAVDPDISDIQIAERMFYLFNVGDDPSHGEPDVHAIEYRSQGNRSLSKGDAIAIDGRFWVCDSAGWTLISTPRFTASGQHGSTPLGDPHGQ
ncbi:hypothetical protein [Amycolatopsis sp. CA-230715]|uniref:hypothetical protein n=1 Tax=Amycolatopsis sp. CA-230715 TaxID=2745196 RepID=UPI001C013B49|nr:hypothetical protein [Amycolatopsis sp. CA-230715]